MTYLIRDYLNGTLLDMQHTPEMAHKAARDLENQGYHITIEREE